MHVAQVKYRASDEMLRMSHGDGCRFRERARIAILNKYDPWNTREVDVEVYNNDSGSQVTVLTKKGNVPWKPWKVKKRDRMQAAALDWLDQLHEELKDGY